MDNGLIVDGVRQIDGDYPANLGTSCQAWDALTGPICADENNIPRPDAPTWCGESWCWVDSSCTASDVTLSWYFAEADLYYTYEACANVADTTETATTTVTTTTTETSTTTNEEDVEEDAESDMTEEG